MKRSLLLASAALVLAATGLAQTATLTPSATTYSAAGGTITFTVELDYTGTMSSLGLQMNSVPAGWSFGAVSAATVAETPGVSPNAGDTGNFGFTYLNVPPSPVTFTFTVNYAGGLSGNQTFTAIQGIFRPQGSSTAQTPAVPDIVFTPAPTPPSITTQPTNQTATAGDTVTFSAQAVGYPAPAYQWKFGSAALADGTNAAGTVISGATTATLTLTGVHASDAGSYTVTATNTQSSATSNAALLGVGQAGQTITFGPLAAKTYGDPAFVLTASASSGLPVTYTSSDSTVATIMGNTLTISGAGNATITAAQAGDADYSAAAPVAQALVVNKGVATVTLSNLTQIYDGTAKMPAVNTVPSGVQVVLGYSNGGAPTTTPPVDVGTYSVDASVVDNNYNGTAAGTLTIAKADQTIAFGALNPVVFGSGSFNLNATASSGLPVTYTSSDPTVATVAGNQVTIVGYGTTTITATQGGDSNHNAAASVAQSLNVTKAPQTITFNSLAGVTYGDATFNLTATASSNLAVSYASSNTAVATVSGNTVTIVGAGTTTITATQAGDANYEAATPVAQTLTVGQKTATVTLDATTLSATYDGNPHVVTATTAPSALTVGITYAGLTTPPSAAGTYAIVATIHDPNYAGSASGTLTIAKANQTITFGPVGAKTFGDADFSVSATASSTLGVQFTSSNPAVATVGSTGTVHIAGAGTATITAHQAGDTNYNAAADVAQTLTVAKAAATVTLDATTLSATYDKSPKVVTATTTPAKLNVVLTYNGAAAAPTDAGTYAVVGTIDDPNYAGSASGSLTIAKAAQTITFAPMLSVALDQSPVTLAASSDSGLPITYTSSDTNVATVSGAQLSLVHTGSLTITASQPGDGNYLAATDVAQPLTVLNASQTVTFDAIAARTYAPGDEFTISAASNRKLQVSFASSDTSVATIMPPTLDPATGVTTATVAVLTAGTTNITASQPGTSDYAAAPDVTHALVINKAAATVTLGGLAATYDGNPHTPTATTAPTGLTVVYAYALAGGAPSTTAPTDAGSYAVTASINDVDYSGSATGTFVIAKAAQTITFGSLPIALINAGSLTLTATASSGLPVVYTSSNSRVATVSGNVVTIVGLGTTTITASQPGSVDFNAADPVLRTLAVNPVAPVITATPPTAVSAVVGSNFLFGPITLNALSAPVTFTMSGAPAGLTVDPGSGNISGIPAAGDTLGSYTITLTATNVTGAVSKTITLTLLPPAPVITSAAAATATAGSSFSYATLAANASSYSATGLPSGLSIDASTGVISGTTTQTGTFTVSVTATNATGSVTLPVVLTIVLPPDAPVYSGSKNLSGTAGVVFSFTPNFGTGTTTFQLTGSLPSGLNFDSTTGAITGTTTAVGAYPVTIAATRSGITASVDLTLTINPAPQAPSVGFGASGNTLSATFNAAITPVTLSATPASGATFSASGLPPGITLDAATGALSGTPTQLGTFTAKVSASSAVAGKGPDATLVITVYPNPNAPAISSAPIVSGRVGQALAYTLTAAPAPTGYALSLGTLPPGLTFDPTTGAVSGTPTTAGQSDVFFTATNADGTGPAIDVTFSILPPLTVPVVLSNGTAAGQVGQLFQYVVTASNNPTAFGATPLPTWASFDSSSGVISGIPNAATDAPVTITLTATNTDGTSASKSLILTIAPAPATPTVTSALAASGRVGTAFTYQMTASDSPTSYVAENLPDGLTIAPGTGAITGTPRTSGTFNVTIRAANAAGLGTTSTLVVVIKPALTAPAITSRAAASGKVGVAFTYTITATSAPTGFAVTGTLPAGLSLNSSTGVLSGTPAESGVFAVQLTATGAGGTSLPQPLALTIAAADAAPKITSPTMASATVGTPFTYQITATANPAFPAAPFPAPFTLDAVDLPPGLAVNPSTGVIQGTPTTVGTFAASLVGTNAAGTGPLRALTITVDAAAAAPVITSAASVNAQAGTPFSYQIVATNSPTSFEALDSPGWMVVDGGTGLITGTPPQPRTFHVRLIASNSAGSSDPLRLTVSTAPSPDAPVVTSTRTASGQLGGTFQYQITAQAPAGKPVQSYLVNGLPSGLSLDPLTGVISGSPSVSGDFDVQLVAMNSAGESKPATLTIHIAPSATLVIPGT